MINNHTISLVIPCYNEEKGLKYILSNLPKCFDEIVIVDNNSTDKSVEEAKKFGTKIVEEKKQGYGNAYKKGFACATQDIIVTMDGDGTYPQEEIEYLVKELITRDLDFISASRFPLKDKGSMLFLNKIGNFVLTKIFNLITFKNIKDCESGMWVFYRSLLDHMHLKESGIPLSVEIKMEAILNKKIKFSEIHINYKERLGVVKMRKWKDGYGSLLVMLIKPWEIMFRKNKKTPKSWREKMF